MSKRVPAPGRDEQGSVLVLATVAVVLAVIATALSVDIGRLAQERRRNQKVADMAALDAVRGIRRTPALEPDTTARTTATLNGFPVSYLVDAEAGTVDADGNFVATTDLGLATAVRVEATSPLDHEFAPGSRTVTARAIATLGNGKGCTLPNLCVYTDGTPLGTVRVGSRFASLNGAESTIFNRLLSQVVGGSYTLDLVGYQGLADGNVNFQRLRTALGVGAGSASTVLDTELTFRQLLDASIVALNADGSPSSVTAANRLAEIAAQVGVSAGTAFTLRNLFAVTGNVGSGMDVADATINVLDVLRGGLVLADNDNFAQFDLLAATNDLPLLQALLPDFVSARVKFGLIEAPQTASGPPKAADGTYRTVATTSQVRLLVEVKHRLNVTGIGLVDIVVPYYVDAGTAKAKLDTLSCAAEQAVPSSVLIQGVTQAASANIGTVDDGALDDAAPGPGVDTLTDTQVTSLIHATVKTTTVTSTNVGGRTEMLTFTPDYTVDGNPQPITGTQLVSLPVLGSSELDTKVTVGGVLDAGLSSSLTTAVVDAVVSSATPLLNNLFQPAFRSLGLSVAGADVWAPPPQDCQPKSFNVDPGGDVEVGIPVLIK